MKQCFRCEETKPIDEFSRNGKYHRSECKVCERKSQAVYRKLHAHRRVAADRKRWLAKREQLLAQNRAWCKRNPERHAEISRNYYARKNGTLGDVPTNIKELLREEQRGLCFYCFSDLTKSHLEHKIPLSRDGRHDKSNLCLSCPSCNLRKGTKTAEEFMGGDDLSSVNVK